MFTGIIEDLGVVISLCNKGLIKLSIESRLFKEERPGSSIAVNGVCLTVTKIKNNTADFDIMLETALKSTLGSLQKTEAVNIERALKANDRLSGHMVSGHVDCVGRIVKLTNQTQRYLLGVKVRKENMKFLVREGSVALDGVSLTVADLGTDSFTVSLIPYTLKNTNLQFKKTGDFLNIEFDMMGKYILNLADNKKERPPAITEEFLRRHDLV
jgi:riboflavin synthase